MCTRAHAAKRKGQTAVPIHTKRARKPVSYRESSDEETGSSDDEPLIQQARLRLSTQGVQPSKRSSQNKSKSPTSRRSYQRPATKRIPWNTLPYQIWLQIFMYGWDLSDTRSKNVSRIAGDAVNLQMVRAGWLLKCALLCHDLTEPALSALYFSPPLHPAWRVHALLKRLKEDPLSSSFQCRNKVRYLTIDEPLIFGRKHNKLDSVSVSDFITHCPQLRGLLVSRSAAMPLWQSYRLHRPHSGQRSARDYNVLADSIMPALESNDIRLREWHWTGYTPIEVHGTHFEEAHQSRPFQTLKHLTISSIRSAFDEITPQALKAYEEDVARTSASLEALPVLQSVRFNKTMIFTAQVLPSFPPTIQLLEITDCSLTSEALSPFLMNHGNGLRTLILDHNDTLNLAFLSTLASSCPKLEALHMDLRFFQQHLAFNDSEPKFDHLLPSGLTPTWPATLQSLELFHLRKWNTNTAGRFFSSLVNSSGALSSLRRLHLKISIEESAWRTRITFRDSWIKRLNAVFKRPWIPPGKSGDSQSTPVEMVVPPKWEKKIHISRGDASVEIPTARRSHRLKDLPSASPKVSTPSQDSRSEDCRSVEDDSEIDFIQGMCNVVDIAIDNLRPAAEQLNEDDFLDEEASGDSDWSEEKEKRRLDAEERNAW